jgi:two-component system chemotaxis sensor kinase CheA
MRNLMPPEGFLQEYLDEVKEHLQELERSLLILEREGDNKDEIAGIFRVAHSIKGISSYMGYQGLATLTHELESLISKLQASSRPVTPEGVSTLLGCVDFISSALGHLQEKGEEPMLPTPLMQELRDALLPESIESSGDGQLDESDEFMSDLFSELDSRLCIPADTGEEADAIPPVDEQAIAMQDAVEESSERNASSCIEEEPELQEEDQELFGIFLSAFQEYYSELASLLDQFDSSPPEGGDAEEVGLLIGKLIGSSRYMGFDKIVDLLDELERAISGAIERGDLGPYSALIAAFGKRFQQHLPELELLPDRATALPSAEASEESRAIQEEDEELFSIFLDSFRQNMVHLFDLTPSSPTEILSSDVLENAKEVLQRMVTSSGYMDYDPVMNILNDWKDLLIERHSSGLLNGKIYAELAEAGGRRLETLLPKLELDYRKVEAPQEDFSILSMLEQEINASLEGPGALSKVEKPLSDAEGRAALPVSVGVGENSLSHTQDGIDLEEKRAIAAQQDPHDLSQPLQPFEQAAQKNLAKRGPISAFAEDIPSASPTLRIDTHKVDQLLNQVGELVVARSEFIQTSALFKEILRDLAAQGKLSKQELRGLRGLSFRLNESTLSLGRIANDLQNSVMRVRMLPISNLFQRFPRVVRDQALRVGKKVELVLDGGETEIDKRILEQMHDPLVQFLRNAIAHGIELPEERKAMGKPAEGAVRLAAYHEGDYVVLEIEDDGRGIDVQKLRESLYRHGAITRHELDRLSDQDLMYAIFLPGISTRDQVDETAGRGVGLDVVKENVERMNGSIEVDSVPGAGTRFTVRIPLTVAIIRALLVKAGDQILTIPLGSVSEILRYGGENIYSIENNEVISLRGKTIPLVSLSRLLNMPGPKESENIKKSIVIVATSFREIGLVVDGLIGEREVVIKPVEDEFHTFEGLSGATILGDGSVSLVLDISALVKIMRDMLHEDAVRQNTRSYLH